MKNKHQLQMKKEPTVFKNEMQLQMRRETKLHVEKKRKTQYVCATVCAL